MRVYRVCRFPVSHALCCFSLVCRSLSVFICHRFLRRVLRLRTKSLSVFNLRAYLWIGSSSLVAVGRELVERRPQAAMRRTVDAPAFFILPPERCPDLSGSFIPDSVHIASRSPRSEVSMPALILVGSLCLCVSVVICSSSPAVAPSAPPATSALLNEVQSRCIGTFICGHSIIMSSSWGDRSKMRRTADRSLISSPQPYSPASCAEGAAGRSSLQPRCPTPCCFLPPLRYPIPCAARTLFSFLGSVSYGRRDA